MTAYASITSARRAAALLVERHALRPPVDVVSLAAIYADVDRLAWAIEGCDGLTYVAPGRIRPQIFYRETQNPQRERFTVAHELGHAILPWHLTPDGCSPDEGRDVFESTSLEAQADLFASSILLPDKWLREIVTAAGSDGSVLLQHLAHAGASTMASLLALRRVLLAGWVFVAYNGTQTVLSAGTHLTPRTTPTELAKTAVDKGVSELNGHPVRWFRLTDEHAIPENEISAEDTRELLKAALSILVSDTEQHGRITQQLNGKVGGGLRNEAGGDAGVLYNQLRYRIQNSSFAEFLQEPLFEQWLGVKARDVSRGTTRRRRRHKA